MSVCLFIVCLRFWGNCLFGCLFDCCLFKVLRDSLLDCFDGLFVLL